MKRITLLVLVLLVMIVASACGSPAPAATEVPATEPIAQATEPPVQPSATEAPTLPTATESAPSANSIEVIVTLEDNTITSSMTEFKVGVPYKFVITNAGNHGHNFNIAQPVSVVGSLNAALSGALLAVPKSQLGEGAQVTVEYTFPESALTTQLELSCLITRHYQDGMFLAITVTQ
ncbi:MAG: hypothetical protein HY864_11565 [Chloroflexi bacterium]|nr:hypothetical protein [Chloroflexota bacterium]